MPLWDKTTGAPKWAPAVRTALGWEHAETGELLVAFADTSYAEPVGAATIVEVKIASRKTHYKTGDTLKIAVTWSEEVKIVDPVHLVLNLGPDIYTAYGISRVPNAEPAATHIWQCVIEEGMSVAAAAFAFPPGLTLADEGNGPGTVTDVGEGNLAADILFAGGTIQNVATVTVNQ